MKKVFVVGYATGYSRPFKNIELVDSLDKADIVLFTGGEDINPRLYGDIVNPKSSYSDRDNREVPVFKEAVAKGKFIIGICRGAQLSCAMSGGILVQHVTGHGCWPGHQMITDDGREMLISSTHHQMMYPYVLDPSKYELVAWSKNVLSNVHESVNWQDDDREAEIVYFKETRALAIQGHPEMMDQSCEAVAYVNELVDRFFN